METTAAGLVAGIIDHIEKPQDGPGHPRMPTAVSPATPPTSKRRAWSSTGCPRSSSATCWAATRSTGGASPATPVP
jgi:hypothetical protein